MTQKAHSKLGASVATRWLACPGSIRLSENVPPEPESKYAQEGTLAHELLELMLTEKKLKSKYEQDMITNVLMAVAWIDLASEGKKHPILVETKVKLSHIDAELYGTLDCAIIEEFGRLTIVDFKYGQGVAVEVEANEQLIFYAIGVAKAFEYNFQDIELVIIQPRANHPDGPIRKWVMSMNELHVWEEIFKAGVAATRMENPVFLAGDHCRWCPAKRICPEISKKALQEAAIEFSPVGEIELPEKSMAISDLNLSDMDISPWLAAFDKLEIWMKAVREHAYAELKAGKTVPGYKLVPRMARRQWVDPEKNLQEATDQFGDACIEKKLRSPAQIEKTFSNSKSIREFVKSNTVSVSSGLTMVKESDRRKAISTIEEDFDPITD